MAHDLVVVAHGELRQARIVGDKQRQAANLSTPTVRNPFSSDRKGHTHLGYQVLERCVRDSNAIVGARAPP